MFLWVGPFFFITRTRSLIVDTWMSIYKFYPWVSFLHGLVPKLLTQLRLIKDTYTECLNRCNILDIEKVQRFETLNDPLQVYCKKRSGWAETLQEWSHEPELISIQLVCFEEPPEAQYDHHNDWFSLLLVGGSDGSWKLQPHLYT